MLRKISEEPLLGGENWRGTCEFVFRFTVKNSPGGKRRSKATFNLVEVGVVKSWSMADSLDAKAETKFGRCTHPCPKGTSMQCELAFFLSPAMSASLAKSVS